MVPQSQIDTIKDLALQVIAEEPQYFIVDLKIKPTNNIKLYVDGDTGITIEKCIKINRALYPLIEAAHFFSEGDFSLEVSSPGIDVPLILHRQYVKNKGRLLEVTLDDDTVRLGTLTAVGDDAITLEITTGKGKKAVTAQENIALANIKKAIIQIQF